MKQADLQTRTLRVSGMACVNCQNRVEKKLKNTAGIHNAAASYEAGTVTVTYDDSVIALSEIAAAVSGLGYKVITGNSVGQIPRVTGMLIIIFALYMVLRAYSTSEFAAAFPVAQTGMGYGMALIIGLVTSIHCIAMCGGINLLAGSREWGIGNRDRCSLSERVNNSLSSQTNLPSHQSPVPSPFFHLLPSILYNAGRLVSYTAVGVVVGALGSVITISGRFQGTALLLAGILMVIMGINLLGMFPALRRFVPRMPAQFRDRLTVLFAQKTNKQKTGGFPVAAGFLNGFMPCGPLQAMQLYALSTGSPVRGGISMFLFCLGTIPLMFALGAASGILSSAKGQVFSGRVMRIGAVLIAAMGLTMFANGWNLAGLNSPLDRITAFIRHDSPNNTGGGFTPVIQNGVQIVNSTLFPSRYPVIVVQQGIPVRWTINAPPGSINGCNNRFFIREYGIEHTFTSGDNAVEFLPSKTGTFLYSCWMGMIRGSITVLAKGEKL